MPTRKKPNGKRSKEKFILPALVLVILALIVSYVWLRVVPQYVNDARLHRIQTVYDSFKLGKDYVMREVYVFGDKRPYDWDKSRSYSSVINFDRGTDVDKTVADLHKHITAAGFTQIDHPYPFQWQYKNKDNVYVRFDATSRLRMDYFRNQTLLGKNTDGAPDMNAGPTTVALKVNLDDNNE